MNILHTSDWHLGHRLHEQSQQYEQQKFLEWLLDTIKEKEIDVLLVAGDIFDTGYPSSQALQMFYDFLAGVYKDTGCSQVVMTAGNHDAPGTINAPGHLVRSFSINLIGKATDNISDEILSFEINGEKLIVAAIPFLRDRDIRRAIAGENADNIESRYRQALTNHYREIAGKIQKDRNTFAVAMGHLFAVGGQTSESENRIYVGGLGDIAADDFPDVFDYVALGHLHRPQKVGNRDNIRYSGSPYPLSFSEAGQEKSVLLIKTSDGQLCSIDSISTPRFRELHSIKGALQQCTERLKEIATKQNTSRGEDGQFPFVEVNIIEEGLTTSAYSKINDAIEGLPVKVLKVRLLNKNAQKGIEQLVEEDKQLEELQPDEIFKKKCEEENFNLSENKEVLDAFYEILSSIEQGS
jgi:exonuclease SbcD